MSWPLARQQKQGGSFWRAACNRSGKELVRMDLPCRALMAVVFCVPTRGTNTGSSIARLQLQLMLRRSSDGNRKYAVRKCCLHVKVSAALSCARVLSSYRGRLIQFTPAHSRPVTNSRPRGPPRRKGPKAVQTRRGFKTGNLTDAPQKTSVAMFWFAAR